MIVPDPDPIVPPKAQGPDTLLILLAVAILAFAASWLAPKGVFELAGVVGAGGRPAIDPTSFHIVPSSEGGGAPFFGSGGEVGFLNFLFEGLVSGDRNAATVGLMAFLLIVGGSFGVVMQTGAVERGLRILMAWGGTGGGWLIPLLFAIFALGGAVFGMGEEAIVFVLILSPALIRAGYDSLTAVLVTYVATQVGFATSWMNPFGLVIAQGIAGVPILSGMALRLVMFAAFTGLAALATWRYAQQIKARPERSLTHRVDAAVRARSADTVIEVRALGIGDIAILVLLAATIGWIAWGVVAEGYYLAEIAGQFFALGLAAGILALAFRLPDVDANGLAGAFREGAVQMAPAVIVVAIAKGVVLLLGGDDPTRPSVLNTLLDLVGGWASHLPDWGAALSMLGLQSVLNLFIASGSGQAALTMPLMAPLADLTGVTRQTSVLAFQLGDGLTNIVCPASAALMGSLAAARIDWATWLRFIWKPTLALLALAVAFVVVATLTGYR
ncbi:putative basic amino acid antiporter YfcC [Brevundimonas sp.]|uniref:putative basic amino acid antiporter YfcC n=1 Tax=Brevundimonas sp. TaxID=1871086 RepID=UPI00286AB58F|nr:putative basic amino acid antiporter YfcC [Brevundimonas sp.]